MICTYLLCPFCRFGVKCNTSPIMIMTIQSNHPLSPYILPFLFPIKRIGVVVCTYTYYLLFYSWKLRYNLVQTHHLLYINLTLPVSPSWPQTCSLSQIFDAPLPGRAWFLLLPRVICLKNAYQDELALSGVNGVGHSLWDIHSHTESRLTAPSSTCQNYMHLVISNRGNLWSYHYACSADHRLIGI